MTRGQNFLNDVLEEIDNANELRNISFASEPTLSGSLMMQRFDRYDKHRKAVDEWYSKLHQAIFDKWLSCYLYYGIKANLAAAINYTLPRFTFRDHLRDCFGWLTYDRHARYDEFVEAFCEKLEEALPWLKSLRWKS